jgi:asparagine synthase (glutamine-hydrolysing)
MCGICGVFGLEDENMVKKMANALKHRGPDQEGFFSDTDVCLGVRRLKIIDLETGNQPIFNESGDKCVILNGEIYNYRELKKRLERKHEFRTESDTEVLIHLYEDHGEDGVKFLKGMFAFAIWDGEKKQLFLGRDELGIKPLVYSVSDGYFVFASEIKSLFQSGIRRKINTDALAERYVFDTVLGDNTLFEGVKQLRPGHIMLVNRNGMKQKRYFSLKLCEKNMDEKTAMKELSSMLKQSVKAHMIADVPVGSLLSGGIDSSIVTCIASEFADNPLKTFSISDNPYDPDLEHARLLARNLDIEHHEIVIGIDEMAKRLPEFVWSFESIEYEPFLFFALSERVQKYVKVLLTGQGADELFSGYSRYGHVGFFKDSVILNAGSFPQLDETLQTIHNIRTLNDFLKYDIENQLPNYQLKLLDHLSMAFGLEARVPYLYRPVIDFANSLPMNFKLNGNTEKYILRKAASRMGIPAEIVKRKKRGAGVVTTPFSVQRFESLATRLVTDKHVEKHRYKQFFRTKSSLLCFDLLNEMFIKDGKLRKNLSITDLY